ncbi:hypothetical protein QYS49_38960 [Marivirga salinae]|uniref:Uncharacterized protein n=1 Tax=Marivirga salinarum TaxID=3059078 RepID=A0AA51NAB2_9BACT|nr:hypothetical protein [Marivirga sp. BDSF4-3]WMN11599.1 hypothetical protein QYS49_38960 [Marivirga sp. BDSF4-3]
MNENNNPLEYTIAERVNGIIKQGNLNCYQVDCMREASELLTLAII